MTSDEARNPELTPDRWVKLAKHFPIDAYLNPSRELFALEDPIYVWSEVEARYLDDWIPGQLIWFFSSVSSTKTLIRTVLFLGDTTVGKFTSWKSARDLIAKTDFSDPHAHADLLEQAGKKMDMTYVGNEAMIVYAVKSVALLWREWALRIDLLNARFLRHGDPGFTTGRIQRLQEDQHETARLAAGYLTEMCRWQSYTLLQRQTLWRFLMEEMLKRRLGKNANDCQGSS